MQVNVYTIISEGQQASLARHKLLEEWKKTVSNPHPAYFPQPSKEAIDAERHHFPLQTFRHTGKVLAYVTGGEYEAFGAIAVVQKEDGFLSEERVEDLQVIQHGTKPVFNIPNGITD